jgi:peptidyl-prolyl cis-trans isomerase B (cyclophilin B)
MHTQKHLPLETSPHSAILWKMKRLIYFITIIGLATSVAMAQNEKKEESKDTKADSKPATANEVAVIKTSQGDMVVEFWSDVAPKTVENFKKLARSGFYDGTAFHRIIKGFMIQGGDPLTKDPTKEAMYGTGDPGYKIKAEFNDKKHTKGVLSMARSQDPDSAGSQFFICLGTVPHLDHSYTAFGKVIKGEDVLEKIGDTPVQAGGRERSKPTQRIEVQSIKIVPADSVK